MGEENIAWCKTSVQVTEWITKRKGMKEKKKEKKKKKKRNYITVLYITSYLICLISHMYYGM